MSDRREGFYWVRTLDYPAEWVPAEWRPECGGYFLVIGAADRFWASMIVEIDEQRLVRDLRDQD